MVSLVVFFAARAILRRELRHLTWEDVDFGRNVLHVRPKDGWQPKTGDKRVSEASIHEDVKKWVPGTRKPADPAKKLEDIKKAFAKMDPQMKAAIMAELRGADGAPKQGANNKKKAS